MTDELERQINLAMEKTGGDATQAACLLDMDRSKLYNYIHNNQSLKARWGGSKKEMEPPSKAVTLHRPAPALNIPDDPSRILSEEEVTALAKEDASVRGGLEAMGIRDDALDLAVSLQKFQNKHFARAIEILGGGIVKQFLDNMVEIAAITARLDRGDVQPAMEICLRQDRAALQEINGKLFDRINKASLTQAIIKYRLNSGEKGSDRPGKPGFAPIIKADNVQINHHAAPPEE